MKSKTKEEKGGVWQNDLWVENYKENGRLEEFLSNWKVGVYDESLIVIVVVVAIPLLVGVPDLLVSFVL